MRRMAAETDPLRGVVVAVSRSATHTMAKPNQPRIRLLAGLGVEGDAHAGATVKHRSRVRSTRRSRTCGWCT